MVRIVAGVLGVLALFHVPARAATHAEVDAAIKKGVAFLYSQQNEHGNWEKLQKHPGGGGSGADKGQWGGRTSLVTYALLAAGEKPLDPRIVKASDFLRGAPITGFYALGLRANVWLHLPPTEQNRAAMLKDARLHVTGISKTGGNKGFHDYQPGGDRLDCSVAQYGVLGSWAAAQWIEEIPPAYWALIETSWRNQQQGNGAWGYNGNKGNPTIQMTAAGVATLFITQEFLHGNDGIEGNKGNITDPWINKGLDFISKNFQPLVQKPNLYALYGIERVGVASGYKYFGNLNWFDAGADAIVKMQGKNGNWPGGNHANEIENTAFALLFLARGGAPVMMNKLQYNITETKGKDKDSKDSKEANWNQRPRDVANATRWVGEKTERTLNWQIINLNVASMRDLYDSPILYMTGNQELSFTDKEKAMLKQYIENGGMIIGNADVGKSEFTRSFRALASELFPEYEFAQLTDKTEHPLLKQQFNAANWKRKLRIDALGNRARLFMILIPNDDLSRTLQLRDKNRDEVFEFFANAYLYSTDKKQGRFKGYTHVKKLDDKINPSTEIKVARLKFNGRWDPEPGGWRQLKAIMNNVDKVKLTTQTVELGKDSLKDFKIAHLTGTDAFAFTEEQRKAVKEFIDAGGLLVVDSCGGFGEFDSSVQDELSRILPNEVAQIVEPLKGDHPIYTTGSAEKLEPKYRIFAQLKLGAESLKFRIRGIKVKDKLAVIYSPDDLSVGLVGNEVDGIIGYEPEVASTLMRRIITLRNAGKI